MPSAAPRTQPSKAPPPDARTLAAQELWACRDDPELFVETMYPWGDEEAGLAGKTLRVWQREILRAIRDHLKGPDRFRVLQIAVASGHGIGKSALMAFLIHWGMTTCVDARGVITANTEAQLRTKTWPESRKWFNRLRVRDFFEIEGMTFRSSDPAHRSNWQLNAIAWSSSNPEAFAGLHNEGNRILILMDEASAIDDKIWEVIEGALTDENTEIILVAFGNPTRAQGRFYDAFHRLSALWKTWNIDSREVEGTNKDQLEQWVRTYGLDSDFVRVRVRGLFPRSASDQLIPAGHVVAAQRRYGEIGPHLLDPLVLGVDVARYGSDESVCATRKGNTAGIHGFHIWRGLDIVSLAAQIAGLISRLQPHYVFVDGGGVGGGLVDVLRSWGHAVEDIQFGAASPDKRYGNMRTYMWARMRDWLAGDVAIPWNDGDLFEQLTQQTYKVREVRSNDLLLTPKDIMRRDGLQSPDRADALALTFAREVHPIVPGTRLRTPDAYTAETDYDFGWE